MPREKVKVSGYSNAFYTKEWRDAVVFLENAANIANAMIWYDVIF